MTLDDLRVFVAVARSGSLSEVARDLSCTQPAVSQRVRRLEEEIGVALVERKPRGVTLTEAGRALLSGAVESLGCLDSALEQLARLRKGDVGAVKIATGGTAVKHFMSKAVMRFRRRFPRVTLEFLSINSTRRCLEALRAQDCHLAWITMGADTPGVEQLPAISMPWALVGPATDPLLRQRRVEPASLRGLRYIPLRDEAVSQVQLRSALHASEVDVDTAASVDDWDTAILLVELGFGYTIVPAIHGTSFARGGRVASAPIDGLPKVTFGWAYRRWGWLTAPTRDFVETLSTELRKIRGVQGLDVHASSPNPG